MGTEITRPLTRLLYSNDMNIGILVKSIASDSKYDLVASLKPLNPGINYSSLLGVGFKSTQVGSTTVFSYS